MSLVMPRHHLSFRLDAMAGPPFPWRSSRAERVIPI
jgi:hypothetical protein